MDNIYIKFERKENEKYREKIFVSIIAASAIFVGIFAIYSDFKEKNKKKKTKNSSPKWFVKMKK